MVGGNIKFDMTHKCDQEKAIFISYSHQDREFVQRLTADMEKEGIGVWLDEKEILVGDSISQKVEQGISVCKLFCLVISSNSAQSRWVEREYRTALNEQLTAKRSKLILPLLIEDIQPPDLIKDIKYAEFINGYHIGFEQLLKAIKATLNSRKTFEPIISENIVVLSQYDRFLEEFKAEIKKVLSDQEPKFNTDKICDKLSVGRSALYRRVKEITGKTPNDFIMDIRLERAAELLRKNAGNVGEVTYMVGFQSHGHFTGLFKKRFKQSPKAYQLSFKKSYLERG
jgi:AraC-like DNA-binding protein